MELIPINAMASKEAAEMAISKNVMSLQKQLPKPYITQTTQYSTSKIQIQHDTSKYAGEKEKVYISNIFKIHLGPNNP